ncbi:thioredoxin-like protein [Kickxella alabastrina]|uniref:thioredoxin-like protein n=1 Tax=Kickxella alabastrina TaxID=61397 RepID=UPI00221E8E0D|nr:thioredoxin-like protein [Kickxella alabastrina]KAI7834519.1 thioredoxin-like protein [Kickxella alabastrina]
MSDPASPSAATAPSAADNSEFYNFTFKTLQEEEFPFEQLRGKVVLIVNTASKCGFTGQYKGLEELNKKYADKGLVVLGFPSNQFGNQEPGGAEEIGSFCQRNFGVTFPIMEKSDVNGDKENEIYKFLKSSKSGILGLKRIKWNFEKFLVDRHGNVVERWASTSGPESLEPTIEKYLAQE